MKSFALATLAGASCLIFTYELTRQGSFILTLVVVAIIGASAGVGSVFLKDPKTNARLSLLALAFVMGALLSEAVVFAHYYFTYGYQDPSLNVGIAVSELEFGVISVVGGVFMLLSTLATSRITRRSSGAPSAPAEL